jgi:hypothetical protein
MIGGCRYEARPTTSGCDIDIIYRYIQGAGYIQVPDSEDLMQGRGFWILLKGVANQCQLTVETTGE